MEELDFDPNNPKGADSIWNYHVWNDVWMARPDLPPGKIIFVSIEQVLRFVLFQGSDTFRVEFQFIFGTQTIDV